MDAKIKTNNGKEPTETALVFLLGPPGSGHLAHAVNVAEQFGYDFLSVDELLQEEINAVLKTLIDKFREVNSVYK